MTRYIDGRCKTRTYISYRSMLQRCYNKKNPNYPNYGGRGIEVCPSWLEDYSNFLRDMKQRPEGTSLDRIDVNGNYESHNCKWSTRQEQAENRREKRRSVRPSKNSKTGVLNVYPSDRGGYIVQIASKTILRTKDFDEACRVAREARLEIYGG